MKKIIYLLALIFTMTNASWAMQFNDIPHGFWAYNEIDRLTNEGIISGYSDNTYLPQKLVTRAEYAAMIIKALGQETIPIENMYTFEDIGAEHWAWSYVLRALNLDISGAVAGDGGHNMCIHVQHAALGAFFLLQLLKGSPELVGRFGGAGEETFIAVVGGVVGLDEVADVHFFLPQGAEEAVPLVEIVHSDLLINIIGKLAASKMTGQEVLYHKMLYYASVNITT